MTTTTAVHNGRGPGAQGHAATDTENPLHRLTAEQIEALAGSSMSCTSRSRPTWAIATPSTSAR